MFKLKKYQKTSLEELENYILEMKNYPTDKAAGVAFMCTKGGNYNWLPEIGSSPFVCIKVPTAGGKTLIAAHSVDVVFKKYLGERNDTGLVMWFVPSDAIREQTLKNLKNRKHPYREALDQKFNNAVKVLELTEAKTMSRDDLANNLCIVITTLAAFRRNDKEWLKAYQDNGSLMDHFENLPSDQIDFLHKDKDGEIIYSLVNVIRLHNPLIIADEGHNVQTELAYDMLKELVPSFVLEFTATPKGKSNVLVDISAKELKDQKMIKMPIFLSNKMPWQETVLEGIEKRKELEKKAKKIKEEYIRPIMLIQAEQEKIHDKKVYVQKIYDFLVQENAVGEEQVAIQTSKTKDLPSAEILSSKKSKIRYIITVNALREGWDCPSAYVLVSVSNLGARLTVEQTIGRIMRLPGASEKEDKDLNSAYVFAATKNFTQASDAVIKGLESNGYDEIEVVGKNLEIKKKEFKKTIKDKDINIPFISVKDEKERKLDYVSDLIRGENIFKPGDEKIKLSIVEDNKMVRVDIGEDGELVRDSLGKLNLHYHQKHSSEEDLINWFLQKIQRSFISIEEMQKFFEKVMKHLQKKNKLNKLSSERFQVKEAIEGKIEEIVNRKTEGNFKILEKNKKIKVATVTYNINESIELLNYCNDGFQKHLYEKAAAMNSEENDLAFEIDSLDNVSWWFRNPENEGFYLQGWRKNKFYPDFIVKTEKGNYFLLEYKGGHLLGSEDTVYKEKLGKKWEKLSDKKYYFYLVDSKNKNNVIEVISNS